MRGVGWLLVGCVGQFAVNWGLPRSFRNKDFCLDWKDPAAGYCGKVAKRQFGPFIHLMLSCFDVFILDKSLLVVNIFPSSSMKLLSDASEYALRGAVWLGQRKGGTFKLREIAEGAKTPPGYLIKALQALTKAGILSAQRGSSGGFSLIRDPENLTILEILEAVDPIERIRSCPLGIKEHGTCLCPMHRKIDDSMALIESVFRDVTVAELLDGSSPSFPMASGPLEFEDHDE